MRSFYLYIDGRFIEVPPAAYLFEVGSNTCIIGIVNSGDDYWLLGDAFLKSYLSIWDDDNGKISLAPH